MQKKLHFVILDNIDFTSNQCKELLENAKHSVSIIDLNNFSPDKLKNISPDCILINFVMSDAQLINLLTQIKSLMLNTTSLIILHDKNRQFDYSRFYPFNIHAYLLLPINPINFVEKIIAAHEGEIVLKFWGVRGTLPVPGKATIYYGGNTNCISVNIAKNHFFIFDAGTGIKELSNYLLKENLLPIKAKIFLTHPHYDHINGIPFFVPLYMKENSVEMFGMEHAQTNIETLISGQMDGVYFPITINEFACELNFHNLTEETFYIEEVKFTTIILNHPGKSLGYKMEYCGKSLCYITDNELYLENAKEFNPNYIKRFIDFIRECNILIIDATYMDDEYLNKVGWGHSSISSVVKVAIKANVKLLCLHHHDPSQVDKDIDEKLKVAKQLLQAHDSKITCIASKEGDTLILE